MVPWDRVARHGITETRYLMHATESDRRFRIVVVSRVHEKHLNAMSVFSMVIQLLSRASVRPRLGIRSQLVLEVDLLVKWILCRTECLVVLALGKKNDAAPFPSFLNNCSFSRQSHSLEHRTSEATDGLASSQTSEL